MTHLLDRAKELFAELDGLTMPDKIQAINEIRVALHEHSPFKDEPVDLVLWVPHESVKANDYNPNVVAPPEMRLLEHSIEADGYTQPIVGFREAEKYEVVDGLHRNRVGRESTPIRERLHGCLPVVVINDGRRGTGDRMASTIRHNRARGKHTVGAMSSIVVELSRRNWKDEKIAKELGMDMDEVLRLKQVSGLADIFADSSFSEAWEAVSEDTCAP